MASFEYKALDSKGKTLHGVIEGDHMKSVSGLLRAQGLMPLQIQATEKESKKGSKTGRIKLKTSNLCVFTRQIATLLNSGMTIEESLNAVKRQAKNLKLISLVSKLRSLIVEGFSFSEALKTYPKSFPEIYSSSVHAGEESGNLDLVMERLADYFENKQLIQQKVSTALVYPAFLLAASVLIVIGLVAYVVPKVVMVFENSGEKLPLLTRVLISISDFLQAYGVYIFVLLIVIAVLARLIFRQGKARYWLHKVSLKMFGIGSFIQNVESAKMARTLSILVGSGVPLLTSMQSTFGVVKNDVLKLDLQKATEEVGQGVPISRALDKNENFPPLLIQMIASGENNGQLSHMLEKAAIATESETQSRIAMFISLFEPIMILFMGSMVLVIVMAILLPIFDLNQVLN